MAELQFEILQKTSPGIGKMKFRRERDINESNYNVDRIPCPAPAEPDMTDEDVICGPRGRMTED
jgi:hypothetical protein